MRRPHTAPRKLRHFTTTTASSSAAAATAISISIANAESLAFLLGNPRPIIDEPVVLPFAIFDHARLGLLVHALLLLLEDPNRVEVRRDGERASESDVRLLVVRFGDQQAAALLLLAFHVQSADLVDLEAVEGLEDALDFDLRGGRDGFDGDFCDVVEVTRHQQLDWEVREVDHSSSQSASHVFGFLSFV
ncbi:hypothetical protein ACB094_02G194000 [Castanea mollissima]